MNRNLANEQVALMEIIRAKTNINLVNCGHCGAILLHEMNDKDIECYHCESTLDQSDCPDFWYEGCVDNMMRVNEEINNDNPISASDVVSVADRLNISPSIAEINEILSRYESEAENDPTATWDLIVENLLYDCVAPKGFLKIVK